MFDIAQVMRAPAADSPGQKVDRTQKRRGNQKRHENRKAKEAEPNDRSIARYFAQNSFLKQLCLGHGNAQHFCLTIDQKALHDGGLAHVFAFEALRC